MKLSAAIALMGSASAVKLMGDDEAYAKLSEKALEAESLGDLGDLTLDDLGEEGGACLLESTGLTLLEHGVPEDIVVQVGEAMVEGAESGATLSEGIAALRALGEAYEADREAQDKVLGDILGKVKGCAEEFLEGLESEEEDGEDKAELAQKGKGKLQGKLEEAAEGKDDDEGDDEEGDDDTDGEPEDDEEKSEIEEDGEDKSCIDDECSGGTDLEDGDEDEDKDEDDDDEGTEGEPEDDEEKSEIEEDDEDKECIDDECSSGTDLALAQIREEAAEVVDKLEEDVEKLIEEAELTEEDLEAALDHVAAKLAEAGVTGEKIE